VRCVIHSAADPQSILRAAVQTYRVLVVQGAQRSLWILHVLCVNSEKATQGHKESQRTQRNRLPFRRLFLFFTEASLPPVAFLRVLCVKFRKRNQMYPRANISAQVAAVFSSRALP